MKKSNLKTSPYTMTFYNNLNWRDEYEYPYFK